MKESLWGYYLVLFGVTISTVMILLSNMTTTNQQNYYLLREVTHAAMNDAIDFSYYREYGSMKINKEKFVENFLRRFSEGISKVNTYKIDFYSIVENPPSVSIKVTSNTGDYTISGDKTNIDVINTIDAILESNNVITSTEEYDANPYGSCDVSNYISKEEGSEGYGYCRIIVKNKLNFDESAESPFITKLREKDPTLVFDKANVKVLSTNYLYPNSTLYSTIPSEGRLSTGQVTLTYDQIHDYSGSIYARSVSLGDVSGVGVNESNYFSDYMAQNIRNVKISVVQDKDTNDFYVAYGAEYNCQSKDDPDVSIGFKTYRNKNYYIRAGETGLENAISPVVYDEIIKNNPNEERNYNVIFNHISEETYNNLSSEQKLLYERAPYYGSCIVSFKYTVDFYYDA